MTKIHFPKIRLVSNLAKRFLVISIQVFSLFSVLLGQALEPFDIPVLINNKVLEYPLAGGLNTPQFSEVDLNDDNLQDLYIFDRTGNVHLTFVNEGVEGESSYLYAPEYAANFPKVNNWVLLRDYNGDGVQDIFSHSSFPGIDGVKVYRGFFENGKINFEEFSFPDDLNIVFFPLSTGFRLPLYVSTIDYPAVDDIDQDGDLDILTFSSGGGFVEFYKNISVESGYGLDSLIYRLSERCWGGFFESGNGKTVDLAETPGDCWDGEENEPGISDRHAGSTLLTLDMDNDSDKEIIMGDVSFNNFTYLLNGGSIELAWMIEQDTAFPYYDIPLDIPVFPVGFSLDLNNDGKRDLIAAPNHKYDSEDKEVAWYYKNTGTDEIPIYEFQEKDFFVEEMVDLGSASCPAFVDYNADGLLDIVVGAFSVKIPDGIRYPSLFLFENTGTKSEPKFELINEDYLNFSQFIQHNWSFSPCFGDMDNDGDMDLLVGEEFGSLFYAENVGGEGNPLEFETIDSQFMGISVGSVSVPQMVDVNRDGLPDLLVGERNGNLNYFPNIGTMEEPDFHSNHEEAPNNPFFGYVDTRIPGYITGYSSPALLEINDEYVLFSGSETGNIFEYSDIDNNLENAFFESDTDFGLIRVGERSHPRFADLNDDGKLEVITGNMRGGLNIYSTELPVQETVSQNDQSISQSSILIFPNPSIGTIFIQIDANLKESHYELSIFNSSGILVKNSSSILSRQLIHLADLPGGVYIVEIKGRDAVYVDKLIVQ
ncbi:MAG: T9SS type A sorting domain-containing protein [Bacteroidetes bacterium]|nr:T9SS type A sorting domain-containing protein [Bacteroidota bacterium]